MWGARGSTHISHLHGAPGKRRGVAGAHLAGVGPLSPNTSGQMSRRLTELIRQGLCSINPQVLPGKAQLGIK